MQSVRGRKSSRAAGSPLILLPGAYMHAQDFLTHGFDAAADIIALETGMEAYLDGSIVGRLHEAISPIRGDGAPVWLAGVSLGGLGALLYAKSHPGAVAGLLLLSPFIGTRGAVAQVIDAGGFDEWQPPEEDVATVEHQLLRWLKSYRPDDAGWPPIYLGYGENDRYAASYRLLAGLLPAGRVVTVAGGHDWETWRVLWDRLLQSSQFCAG
jgi:pimeloyl-ACP methyl ester carboxylesterase